MKVTVSIYYAFLTALFNPLHSSMNQELFESPSVTEVATMKDTNGVMQPR